MYTSRPETQAHSASPEAQKAAYPYAPDGPPIEPLNELGMLLDELNRIGRVAGSVVHAQGPKHAQMHYIATRVDFALMHVRNLLRHHDTRFYPRADASEEAEAGGAAMDPEPTPENRS